MTAYIKHLAACSAAGWQTRVIIYLGCVSALACSGFIMEMKYEISRLGRWTVKKGAKRKWTFYYSSFPVCEMDFCTSLPKDAVFYSEL